MQQKTFLFKEKYLARWLGRDKNIIMTKSILATVEVTESGSADLFFYIIVNKNTHSSQLCSTANNNNIDPHVT